MTRRRESWRVVLAPEALDGSRAGVDEAVIYRSHPDGAEMA